MFRRGYKLCLKFGKVGMLVSGSDIAAVRQTAWSHGGGSSGVQRKESEMQMTCAHGEDRRLLKRPRSAPMSTGKNDGNWTLASAVAWGKRAAITISAVLGYRSYLVEC
jgi:hypothetical protein